MRFPLIATFGLALVFALMADSGLRAEDWKTTDGTVYEQVKVIKAEADAVTILHQAGGALVPLSKLPPDLQKRFHYDPDKAMAAEIARFKAELENERALEAETRQIQQMKLAALAPQDPNPVADPTADLDLRHDPFLSDGAEPNHHAIGEILNVHQRLSDTDFDSSHYSQAALVSSLRHLSADYSDPSHHSMGELAAGAAP